MEATLTIYPVIVTVGISSQVATAEGAGSASNGTAIEVSEIHADTTTSIAGSLVSTSTGLVGSISTHAVSDSERRGVGSTLQSVVSPTTEAVALLFTGIAAVTRPTLFSTCGLFALLLTGYLVL